MRDMDSITYQTPDVAAVIAVVGARAAFRDVPALREE